MAELPQGAGPCGEAPEDNDDVIIEEMPQDVDEADAASAGDCEARGSDKEIEIIEREKKHMTSTEKLERSIMWKAEGNEFFKKDALFKAADAYYHAILYCRDLTQNPVHYPSLGHNEGQRQQAKDLCESLFTNLAIVQGKYASSLALDHPERDKVLSETAKSAAEALKLNNKNVKARFRRAVAHFGLARGPVNNEEAQRLCSEAKADLVVILENDPTHRDARAELKAVQEHLKQLKREEIASERREFSFASTLSALSAKVRDLLGDGSVRKQQVSVGDGGKWVNTDWLHWEGSAKCVVHVELVMLSCGGDAGCNSLSTSSSVALSFILGDTDMHEGFHVAVKSMSIGEVAQFTFAPCRLRATSSLTKLLPDHKGQTSVWQVTFKKFVTWEDLERNGERLRKVLTEGYGPRPEALAEVFLHWRIFGPDGAMLHSSRYTLNLGEGGLKNVEDEDKPAASTVLGENTWEPLATLCRALRQGGVAELRMRQMPALPQQDSTGDANVSAQLSTMLNKANSNQVTHHCVVRAELERVIPALAGPSDPRWTGIADLLQEHLRAEQLIDKGQDNCALVRLQRVVSWAEQLAEAERAAVVCVVGTARAHIGWLLACRAAPVLDLGNVTSDILAAARRDLAEAEEQCLWLESHRPEFEGTLVLRAKILVAQDDDFIGAHARLLEAQRVAPNDTRVQIELKKIKVELKKQQEECSRAKVLDIRDKLKLARVDSSGGSPAVIALLQQLSEIYVSWETVMVTRIGVELKACQDQCCDEAKRLCNEILGRWKDETKEQRPMWDT